jgi:hypothetical protein
MSSRNADRTNTVRTRSLILHVQNRSLRASAEKLKSCWWVSKTAETFVRNMPVAQRVLNDLQRIRLSRMIWLLSHPRPPPRKHVVSLSHSSSVSLVELTDGRRGRELGEESNHTTSKKSGCSYLPVLSKTGTSLYGTVTWLINVLTELSVAVINHWKLRCSSFCTLPVLFS